MRCITSKFHLCLINVLNLKITIKAISVVTQGKKPIKSIFPIGTGTQHHQSSEQVSENKKRHLLATNDLTGVSSNSAQEWSYCQLCSVYVKLHPFGPFRSSNRAFPCSSTLSKQFDGVEPLTQFNYQDLIDNFLILLLHICKSVTRIIVVLDQGYVFYLKCEFYHYMFAGY